MASVGMPAVWAPEPPKPVGACRAAAAPHAVHAPPRPPATPLIKPSTAAQPFLEALPSNAPIARGGVAGPAGACLPSSPSNLGWAQGFRSKYRLGEVLGRGANATVRSAVDIAAGNSVAVKILEKSSVLASRTGRRSRVFSPRVIAEAREEGLTWSTVQAGPGSESIVTLLETFEDDEHIYFVSELCAGGSLESLMRQHALSEEEIALTFYHILNALNTCHSQHIFYGDIKPANFLVRDAYPDNGGTIAVKMTDFGCACFVPDGTHLSDKRVGTPLYKSPESFITSYDKKADLWGAGVILYQLVTGHLPFWKDWATVARCDERQVIATILHGDSSVCILDYEDGLQLLAATPTAPAAHWLALKVIYDESEWQGRSAALKDLVSKLLMKNPDQRISAAEALQHPFLASA